MNSHMCNDLKCECSTQSAKPSSSCSHFLHFLVAIFFSRLLFWSIELLTSSHTKAFLTKKNKIYFYYCCCSTFACSEFSFFCFLTFKIDSKYCVIQCDIQKFSRFLLSFSLLTICGTLTNHVYFNRHLQKIYSFKSNNSRTYKTIPFDL